MKNLRLCSAPSQTDRVSHAASHLALIAAVVWASLLGVPGARAQSSGRAPVVLIQVHSAITRATSDYVKSALTHAQQRHAQLLIIELDTPGGLLDATRTIVKDLLDAPVPVAVYVAPAGARAGSAGVFLTLAAHFAAMVPASNIGAAHPVGGFGSDVKGDMGDKVTNDTAAWARSLAETRGRNPKWAEKAVTKSESITAAEALKLEVIDLTAPDLDTLLATLDGKTTKIHGKMHTLHTRGVSVEDYERSGQQKLYDWLANPSLVYLLLLLGMLGLFLEFQNPGMFVPGALGLFCLVLVFGVQALPINALGAALILAAGVLLVLEIYVTSFGLLTIAGLACLVIGSYMLFDVPESTVRLDPVLIWTVAVTFAVLLLGTGVLLARAKLQGPTSGVEALAGKLAVVREPITPKGYGKIFFDGTYWNACADQAIPAGTTVEVERIDGLLAHVRPAAGEH